MEVLIRTALMNALTASMLAMLVAAVGLVLSRRPAVLHCLWLIVLVKLIAPPVLEVPLFRPEAFFGNAGEPTLTAPADLVAGDSAMDEPSAIYLIESVEADGRLDFVAEEQAEGPAPWFGAGTFWACVGAVWLTGSLAAAALAVVRVWRFQRVLRDAESAEPEVEEEVATLAGAMGVRRPPGVVFVEGRLTPMLWAVGRPRLVIPRSLWKGLDADRRRMLATHELAHLRRGDHWLRFLELAVTVAYWWLPVVWWVRRALRDVEEQCCDAWVVWMFPDHARTYAETLLDTVDFLNPVASPEPLLASGFGKVQHLRRRLTMVMLGTTPRTLGWSGTLGAVALAGLLLPMSPTWAQKVDATAESFTAKSIAGSPVVVLRTEGDDAKPDDAVKSEDVLVLVKDEAPEGEVVGGLEKAIQRLTAQIEELASQTKDEKSGEARERKEKRIEALRSALDRLKTNAKELRQARSDGLAVGLRPERRIVVTRDGDVLTDDLRGESITVHSADGKPSDVTIVTDDRAVTVEGKPVTSPDGKAIEFKNGVVVEGKDARLEADQLRLLHPQGDPQQIQAARKRVEELNRELEAKQKELTEANRKLAELQGVRVQLREVRVPGLARRSPIQEIRALRFEKRDDARLDSLEKKLSKVLEELESLKKGKEGQTEKK